MRADFRFPITKGRADILPYALTVSGLRSQVSSLAYCILIAVFCLTLLPSAAESAFVDRGGVRPLGMGGAFVALADDTSAVIFNPAGLGQIDKTEIAAAYDKLYAGLGDDSLGRGYLSYIHPSQHYGALAFNLDFLHTPLYKETTITLGYGRSLGPLYLGLNTKGLFTYFKENAYTQIDPLFSNGNTSSNGLALDLGMLYRLTDGLSFGLAAMNVNQPDMALDEDADAKVPYTLQTGLALKLGDTVSTVDMVYRNKDLRDKRDINLHLGLESWLAERSMALRGGVNFRDIAVGASYVFSRRNNVDARIDYAFRYPIILEDSVSSTYGTHQFSLNIRFGGIGDVAESVASEMTPEPGIKDSQVTEVEHAARLSVEHAARLSVEHAARLSEDDQSDAGDLMNQVMQYRREGKLKEGIELCSKVLEKEGDQVQAHIQMGGMLTELGRYEEALEHFQLAVKGAPQDPRTRHELAVFYGQYGDHTGNKNWYNKAIIELEKTRMIDSKFEGISSELEALRKKT